MNEVLLKSDAEQFAEKAESLSAFSGLKLLHVKKQVAAILAQIGRDGIFDEYTKHDITHIDYMLESLNWIIPESTKAKLTSSDWLMLTLSIYFHDLGMLVTKCEFENRDNSYFSQYKQEIINGEHGLDYKEKIFGLKPDRQDRFIYQELVRRTHAERIRYWILDEYNSKFENDKEITDTIKNLISSLDKMFRRDLAIICESHHLSDLENFEKYKPNQQYGQNKDEKVNLHYCALILRTADLLHITSDRTPSIEYKLINPTDPISQDEWAKQKAVKVIRPQSKKNKEGLIDDTIPKDSLEILAMFEQEKGFFGLISYIDYANKQLVESFKFNELCNKQFGIDYSFPWKYIDDSNIETEDFEKKQFEFILDQTKILELLVGHTLYNDSTVVLRELTQNAIDASKLKKHEYNNDCLYEPNIKIKWDKDSRELIFIDNGTGMTLEIIQNHLLKVGSSRYQDESFKKKYPDFSPISRFGIGLLTCFLIADNLDITTKTEGQEKGIQLKIRKVHGKYLLKYLSADKLPKHIKNHGTEIKLFVRADVNLGHIENELNHWILFPNCKIELESNGLVAGIGYDSPKKFLEATLEKSGYIIDNKKIKVEQVVKNDITLAYALEYVDHWKEWKFLEYRDFNHLNNIPTGICIEGVRVDFNTPGFQGKSIYSVANCLGKNAPKTNVARSNIELTPEREKLLLDIYKLYLNHISHELDNLKKEHSITWAANEGNYLLNIFANRYNLNRSEAVFEDKKIFDIALSNMDCILVEKDAKRSLTSVNKLKESGHFWTIDCASYSSANSLIKEIKSSNSSALGLLKTIYGEEDSETSHIDTLLCSNFNGAVIDDSIKENFQVDLIRLFPEHRRIDLRWTYTSKKFWQEINISGNEGFTNESLCYIQVEDLPEINNISEIAVNSSNALFILKNSDLNKYLIGLVKKLNQKSLEEKRILSKLVGFINSLFYHNNIKDLNIDEFIENKLTRNRDGIIDKKIWELINKDEFMSVILKTTFLKYDTTIWRRRMFFF